MLATSPAVFETDHFLGYGAPREGRVTPGDHLQTAYNLWLPGHQLARGARPWVDPYSFQPEIEPRVNFAGWPFAVVYGPLRALLGTVAGWNLFVLLSYAGAGGLAALWLRALGLPLGAAIVGGLAFTLAPYRVAQSTGHLLGPISMLLPLALYGLERRQAWLAALALASIPLSGQVHLALGAVPFVLAYALARRRAWLGAIATAAGVAAGVVVWALSLHDAVERPYSEVERYSASVSDFFSRNPAEFERFTYVGWVLPVVALAGVGCLCFRSTISSGRRLALVLGLGVLAPCLLALGASLPGYGVLWRHTPLHSTRVPERLLPIACLCLAGLAAAAVACVSETRARSRLVAAVAALVVAADLWVPLYDPLNADEGNAVYARVAAAPSGRLLEVPVLAPDSYAGSVYLYYAMQAPRERPLGYSTAAPSEAFRTAGELPGSARDLGVSVVVEYSNGAPVRATRDLRTPLP
ncbi:MAG TPA: hypothetical protein VM049_07920 [Gaiellaceae bacterium]|nr:hypothetical protein [Gaiellaceae bacterium]